MKLDTKSQEARDTEMSKISRDFHETLNGLRDEDKLRVLNYTNQSKDSCSLYYSAAVLGCIDDDGISQMNIVKE